MPEQTWKWEPIDADIEQDTGADIDLNALYDWQPITIRITGRRNGRAHQPEADRA